ncbi:hypothetical protein ACFPVS_10425 [Neisseria weixii]|uniref:hypothetical protein n=1 Tax=Neisseria weixii TaxID=1853276 RepID=UPI000BB7BB72|nr:hypothetical protein [Neisseria weixii]ATD65325.1 hypothetical protein CGZ65_08530 [Neisseria weixii]
MKHAFILSDCEYPECDTKPFALLTANPTKMHHYVAQTEQRQHAHNSSVGPQNQNVYRLPISLFHKPYRGEVDNVNIITNLAAKNLYTLAFVENSPNQYNLESWFNRHESGYEDSCQLLRNLPAGRLNAPDAVWRILRLKLLGILRNPNNHKTLFAHRLHQAIRRQLPEVSREFVHLIRARDPKRIRSILQDFDFNFHGYVNWLSNLYGMLSDGVSQPSLFEQMFRAAFDVPEAVKIELYRYPDNSGLCLFNDRSFCLQESKKEISVGVNLTHDMFVIVHVQLDLWRTLKSEFPHKQTRKQGEIHIYDHNQTQRLTYNRLTIKQARAAVYGLSHNHRDYVQEQAEAFAKP